MTKQNCVASMGRLISAMAERIAIGILIEATKDDYLTEIDEELEELAEAVNLLTAIDFTVPHFVNEVFRLHIECCSNEMSVN